MIWDDDAVRELALLLAEGWSHSQIGNRMGCSKGQITGKLARLGWKKPLIPVEPRPEPVDLTDTLPPLESLRAAPKAKRVRNVAPKPDPPQRLPEPVGELCGWMEGDPPSWRRCDAPVWRNSAWCEKHRRLVYTSRRAVVEDAA